MCLRALLLTSTTSSCSLPSLWRHVQCVQRKVNAGTSLSAGDSCLCLFQKACFKKPYTRLGYMHRTTGHRDFFPAAFAAVYFYEVPMVPFTTTPVDKPRAGSIAGERRESDPANVTAHTVNAPQEPDVAPRLLPATVLHNDAEAVAAAHELAAAARLTA
ncbi:Acyl-CoA dehydrogenase, partial [Pseudomonas coronafaciens pv. garcae]